MKITVLGSGGFGYPLTFCTCNNCTKARELGGKNIRKRASILINDEMIVDLTPDCQTAMNMYNKDMSNVKYLLQTHSHVDHFDANQFTTLDLKYCVKLRKKLNLICSDLCLKDINYKSNMYDKMNLYDNDYLNKINVSVRTINHGDMATINNYSIKAIHCTHDDSIGAQLYLIKQKEKTVFYATDSPDLSEIALEELKCEKIDCVFLDQSFGVRDYCFSHLNLNKFFQNIKKLRDQKVLKKNCLVYAIHMTHDGNPIHEELEKQLREFNCNAAYDGMEINL